MQTEDYLSDDAINTEDEDCLGFGKYVLTLKELIDKIPIAGTHSIAITGGWGKGKTSFLNLLQEELNKRSSFYEVMRFEPLKSVKTSNIQDDFFDAFNNSLLKYKNGFSRHIKLYKKLIGAFDNKYISFWVKIRDIQEEEERKKINDIIKKIPKRIIIIIDDVDRLKSDEIAQIFRLIKFNAKFDNVVFLLALDKRNVISILNCDKNYPDKFFEMEYALPDYGKNATPIFMNNTIIKTQYNNLLDFLHDEEVSHYTAYCLGTLRDAKRFTNYFIDAIKKINLFLDIRTFYLLSLVRYKCPAVYEQIKNQDLLELKEVAGEQCFVLISEKCSALDEIIVQMLQVIFSTIRTTNFKYYIFQPECFNYYFNTTSSNAVTKGMLKELLSSESDAKLQLSINKLSFDNASKQSIIDILRKYDHRGFLTLLSEKNDRKRFITNYYRACYGLGIDTGLSYSEGMTHIQMYPSWNGMTWMIPGKESDYAYIDKQGFVVFTIKCHHAYDFSEGLALIARVKNKSKNSVIGYNLEYGFINAQGETIIPFEYKCASPFSEGLACVNKGSKWYSNNYGFINKNGETIIPFYYDNAYSFSEGLACVKRENKYEWVNDNFICIQEGKWGFINTKGETMISFDYNDARSFSEGLACVKKEEKWGFINAKGETIIPFDYDDVHSFSGGLACVKKEEKWGFINAKGETIIPFDYGRIREFIYGLACVEKEGKWGFIDKDGKNVIPFIFDWAYDFCGDLTYAKKDDGWGCIDNEGNVVIPFFLNDAFQIDNYTYVNKEGNWGYVDKNGDFNQIIWKK